MHDIESIIKKYPQFCLVSSSFDENFMPTYNIRHLTTQTTYSLEINGYIYDMESWIDNWIKERICEERNKVITKLID